MVYSLQFRCAKFDEWSVLLPPCVVVIQSTLDVISLRGLRRSNCRHQEALHVIQRAEGCEHIKQ
jgi:hypothetical protein